MPDKEKILGRIRALQLKEKELPSIPVFQFDAGLKAGFKAALELAKATVIETETEQIPVLIEKQYQQLKNIYSGISGVPGNIRSETLSDKMILNEIERFTKKSKEEKDEFLNDIKNIVKHNQKLFLDYSKEQYKNDCKKTMNILLEKQIKLII